MTKCEFLEKINGYVKHRFIYLDDILLYTSGIVINSLHDEYFIVETLDDYAMFVKGYSDVKLVMLID